MTVLGLLIGPRLVVAIPDDLAPAFALARAAAPAPGPPDVSAQYVDVHSHLHGMVGPGLRDFEGAADIAIAAMNRWGVRRMLVMPPPIAGGGFQERAGYECSDMNGALARHPDRFALLCGGGTLNVLLQRAVAGENVRSEAFKNEARRVAGFRGFVGFGEMTAEHFCMSPGHPYQTASPDHDLFKALVDVASEKNVPVDVHMEAVAEDMPFPALVTGGCPANPPALRGNISGLKNLLVYAKSRNPPVRIIWSHLGWDHTRQRTAPLCDRLLTEFDNLFMSIKVSPNDSPVDSRVGDAGGNLKAEWLALLLKHPTRVMIGADHFFVAPRAGARFPPSFDQTWAVVSRLPVEVAGRLARDNALAVFNLR